MCQAVVLARGGRSGLQRYSMLNYVMHYEEKENLANGSDAANARVLRKRPALSRKKEAWIGTDRCSFAMLRLLQRADLGLRIEDCVTDLDNRFIL